MTLAQYCSITASIFIAQHCNRKVAVAIAVVDGALSVYFGLHGR
ncbi:hypothetical protein [Paraburkholderia azotifigens]